MNFGKKIRTGNFEVIKTIKSLDKASMALLRKEVGFPDGIKKYITRARIPYITVRAISGMWSVSWIYGTSMFAFFDSAIDDKDKFIDDREESVNMLIHLMFNDTCVLGDAEYISAKGKAIGEMYARIHAQKEEEGGKHE